MEKYTIGVWVSSFTSYTLKQFHHHIERAARARNCRCVSFLGGSLYDGPFNTLRNQTYLLPGSGSVDGIIVWSSIISSLTTYDACASFLEHTKPLPLVSIGLSIKDAENIIPHDYQGAYDSVLHCIVVHGRSRIACLRGAMHKESALQRYQGYVDALRDSGIALHDAYVYDQIRSDNTSVDETLVRMGSLIHDIDAWVCFDDNTARTLIRLLAVRGVSVPRDASVVGFDNIPESRFNDPPLSTVAMPIEAMAIEAVDRLIAKIGGTMYEGGDHPHLSRFVARQSCGCGRSRDGIPWKACAPDAGVDEVMRSLTQYADDLQLFSDAAHGTLERFMRFLHDVIKGVFHFSGSEDLARQFTEFLNATGYSQGGCSEWQKFFNHVSACMMRRHRQPEFRDRAEDSLRLLRETAAEWNDVRQHGRLLMEVHRRDTLSNMSYEMSSRKNYEELFASVQGFFRPLGIRDCTVVFLCEPGNIRGMGTILYGAYRCESADMSVNENITADPFPVEKILPQHIMETLNWTASRIVLPLITDREYIGYSVISIDHDAVDCVMQIHRLLSTGIVDLYMHSLQSRMIGELTEARESLEASHRTHERLFGMSITDELTGLLNRRGFYYQCDNLRSDEKKDSECALFAFDLDNLKPINDIYGHEEGDNALLACAHIISSAFRKTDICARMGGDEFAVIAADADAHKCAELLSRVRDMCSHINSSMDKPYEVSFSVGIEMFRSNESRSIEEILSTADIRLYDEKRAKKGMKA